jgi:hypothetical protein
MKTLTLTLLTLLLLAATAAAQVQILNAWWTDTGETDSTQLGLSLANLGDVNGDGCDDFCAGGKTNTIYIYHGSPTPDSEFVECLHSPGDSIRLFGYRMHNVGDVNGDGGEDLLIQGMSPSGDRYFCFLYFGGVVFDTIPDLIFPGEIFYGSGFGYYAGGIGDFNGDGGNDFVVNDGGVEIQPYPNTIMGRTYLYYGGALLDTLPDLTFSATEQFNRNYGEIAELGDVNGDGHDDFFTGNFSNTYPNGYSCGAALYFSGGSPPNLIPDWFQFGDTANVEMGVSVAGIDFNHDCKKDLIVGKLEPTGPNYYTHYVNIYWGGTQISNTPNQVIVEQNNTGVGSNLRGLDFNGDGYEDIVSSGSTFTWGNAKVYLGGQNCDLLYDCYIERPGFENRFGETNLSCDVNGDEIDDLIIGEPESYFEQGRIHIIKGNTSFHQSVGVNPKPQVIPVDPKLSLRAYPNPFNNSVNFQLNWIGNPHPSLTIYNIQGVQIKTVQLNTKAKEAIWDGKNEQNILCESGIYFAKLSTETSNKVVKIALIK